MCEKCLTVCEIHGLTYCKICHVHPGECDFGGCESPARTTFDRIEKDGRISETRAFCAKHACFPQYAVVRAGMAPRV